MRTKAFAVFAFACAMLVSVYAAATPFNTFEASADCDGWSVYADAVIVGDYVDFSYDVVLVQGSATIAHFSGTERGYKDLNGISTLDLNMAWGVELCGDYEVNGTVSLTTIYGAVTERTFYESFTCECEEDGYCNFTPGYWKNHPEAWPVASLDVGGVTYTMSQLMDIFAMPTVKDMSVKLAHHLIAAKLNVLSGSYNDIQDVIDDADAFLADHPIGSKPSGEDKDYAEDLKDMLEAYNEMGCDEEDDEMELDAQLLEPTLNATGSAGAEEKSWGAIKDIYK